MTQRFLAWAEISARLREQIIVKRSLNYSVQEYSFGPGQD